MRRLKSFNVINAIRFDMNIHGGRFIIIEFIIASLIIAGVVAFSAKHYFSVKPSFLGFAWIFSFLGILLNCIIILVLALKISKSEGNRPTVAGGVNPKFLAVMFTISILTPYLLSFITCDQVKEI